MASRKKPSVTIRRDGDPDSALVEVAFQDGTGCLISFWTRPDGEHQVYVYRQDGPIVVEAAVPPRRRRASTRTGSTR